MVSQQATLIEVSIVERLVEADGIVSLRLAALDGKPLPRFEAGAHVEVYVAENLVRHYSLCNDPSTSDSYRLGILLDPNSRGGSAQIHRDFSVGRTIYIGQPKNSFALFEAAKHSVLVAGGIGVTPLLAMAYRLDALGKQFKFHYCVRSRARAAFLAELEAKFGDRAVFHFDDGCDRQRFSAEHSLSAPGDGAHLYVCGPPGFMDYVTGAAKRLGWRESTIHIEYFSAQIDSSGEAFTVCATRSGVTAEVLPGETIAEVLRRHGVRVALSCESGVCGTCLTTVLEGVPDHRDIFQTDVQKASNTQIALCCSRAKSKLVLDI